MSSASMAAILSRGRWVKDEYILHTGGIQITYWLENFKTDIFQSVLFLDLIYLSGSKWEIRNHLVAWWRHQMETFCSLTAIRTGNSPVSGEFPTQRPVTWSFDAFFDLRLYKQSWGWWFQTLSRPLWRHCNGSSWNFSFWSCCKWQISTSNWHIRKFWWTYISYRSFKQQAQKCTLNRNRSSIVASRTKVYTILGFKTLLLNSFARYQQELEFERHIVHTIGSMLLSGDATLSNTWF